MIPDRGIERFYLQLPERTFNFDLVNYKKILEQVIKVALGNLTLDNVNFQTYHKFGEELKKRVDEMFTKYEERKNGDAPKPSLKSIRYNRCVVNWNLVPVKYSEMSSMSLTF